MSSGPLKNVTRLNAFGPLNLETGALTAAHGVASSVQDDTPAVPSLFSSIWNKTRAIQWRPDPQAVPEGWDLGVLALKVSCTVRPISLTEGDGWLASVVREDATSWVVGIYRRHLMFQLRGEADIQAGVELLEAANKIEPWIWMKKRWQPAENPSVSP